ncbi:cation-translocating P-type ATPase [Massilia sp. YMA4]|uniref:heavy metal translocating P-type ATPase n=1 Tax=Massilia sp. YMA4 TaxID=1593482 RepID=UPI001D0C29F3|nr:heavy metal translocating P-type ATPase [Massilia sp. YMA4]
MFHIENMCCPVEEKLIRNRLAGMVGISGLQVDLLSRHLAVSHEPGQEGAIGEALASIGMHAIPLAASKVDAPALAPAAPHLALRRKLLLGVSGVAACTAEAWAWSTGSDAAWPVVALTLLSIGAGGLPTLRKGWIALKTFTLNINFLMCLAVIGAMVLGQWPEAAMVIFLFAVAEQVESLAVNRARNAIGSLLHLAPDEATILRGGIPAKVPVARVKVGDTIRVKPGERIALDGTVSAGASSVNQAPITGESMPVDKAAGESVFAGTINGNGALYVRVTAASADSTLAKIIRVLAQAQQNQAPIQRFIDTFARYYTPAVVAVAVAVAVLPPLLWGQDWTAWLYKALVLLVIACPCALVISTPVTVVSGLTAATRRGILVKGGQFLEIGHRMAVLALDKTGTLTAGRPEVTSAVPAAGVSRDELLSLAASLDAHSSHPLAQAIVRAGPPASERAAVGDFVALPGRGVRGTIGGAVHYLGNERLLDDLGLGGAAGATDAPASRVWLTTASEVLGVIEIADTVRPGAAAAIAHLKTLGVRTVMLTGDNAATAYYVAGQVGIDEVQAGLLPEDKLAAIDALQRRHAVVGMVGDGINDAPALARARIGFAMGAAGSDAAIETADVALMDDDLRRLPDFVALSRRTRAILWQNIAAALGIKLVFFALALGGSATLWMAVFADVGASVLVVFNGLRLLARDKDEPNHF